MIVVGRHVFFRAVLRWGAALAFCYPLKHRERFWLRAVELLLSLMALTWLLDPRAPKVEKPEIIQDIHGKLLKAFNI